MSARVSVVGEALIDLVDTGTGRDYTAHPGGSPFNVAVGLARLGRTCSLLARLSDDAFGRMLRAQAHADGVDLSAAARAAEPTTLAVVSLDDEGRAGYDFYIDGTADWQWTPAELALPHDTRIAHFGSLASWTPPGAPVIAEALARARAGGVLVSYDPNVRPRLMGDPADARLLVDAAVRGSDVVKASDEDLAWLYPDADPVAVATGWSQSGPALVVVTRGADGAVALRPGSAPLHRPGRPVQVVDTVGAGDSFTSGLLAALVEVGILTAHPDGIDDETTARVLDHAILVSALTCLRAGADPPTAAEVRSVQQGPVQ